MAEKKKMSFADLAKSLKESADASLGYISKGDTITVIPTGSIVLDKLSGKGGIPVGRITQIASEPGIGKSTSALTIAASCQKLGGKVLYMDFEQSLTAEYIEKMGCVLDNATMIFLQPTDIETAWEIIIKVSSMDVNLVVLDSLASMFPRLSDEDFGDLHTSIGHQSKGLGLFIPRLKILARVENFAVLMINQVRAKIEMGFMAKFQKSPAYAKELPGGFAPKFYTDLLFYLSLKKTERNTDKVYTGNEITVTTWKNKIGVPFLNRTMYLQFGTGIDDFRSVVDTSIELGVITYNAHGGLWSLVSSGDYPGVASGDVILSGRGRDSISEQLAANGTAYTYVRNKVIAVDFITESLDTEEASAIKRLLDSDNPSALPDDSAEIPPPAMSHPGLPRFLTVPVDGSEADPEDDQDLVLPAKRGRPKKG